MDFKTSRKEKRIYKDGSVDVLMDNICDLFPVLGDDPRFDGQEIYTRQGKVSKQDRKNIIMDVDMLDNDADELIDRATFAVMKQRGGDPTEPADGIQWAEAVLGEISPILIVQQVHRAVAEEGPSVKVEASTVKNKGRESLVFSLKSANIK